MYLYIFGMRKCKFMSLSQDSSRNFLVLIDMFLFWRLDDSYLTSSANFAFTIKLLGLLMNLRQSGDAASFDVYTGGVLCRSGTLPRILRSWWKEVFLASTWTPQELHPSIPLWWKWTHTGLTRWFVVALYDCLLLEDSCCFSSRRLSDGLQCIWISSEVLWTLRARGGRCWSSSVDSLRLQNLSGRVWPAQQIESTWYV